MWTKVNGKPKMAYVYNVNMDGVNRTILCEGGKLDYKKYISYLREKNPGVSKIWITETDRIYVRDRNAECYIRS